MSSFDKITLIIPTHFRHKYLKRLLEFYKEIDIKIFVADSSDDTFQEWQKYNIEYFHYPKENYIDKLTDVVAKVKTEYMIFCADDDFIIPEALKEAINFLENNKEYSFCQGKTLQYQVFGKNKLLFWDKKNYHLNESNEPLTRVKTNVGTAYYGLNKTNNIIEWLKFVNEHKNEYNGFSTASHVFYLDGAFTKIVALNGKYKKIDTIFGIREYSPYFGDKSIFVDTLYMNSPLSFYKSLSKLINKKLNLNNSFEILEESFKKEFQGRIKLDCNAGLSKKRFISKFPKKFVNFIEFVYKRLTLPIIDPNSDRELAKTKDYILKFNIK
jgi:glycosyltransferase domain-containing protein